MTDGEILALYRLRDQRASAETQTQYGALCRAAAKALLGSDQDAEECVNDTLLRLWESIPPAAPANLGGYCLTVCRRIALDRRRRQHAEKRGAGEVQICMEELENVLAAPERPDDAYDTKALSGAIARFLDTLPAQARVMFVLRYWSCLPVAEVARQCGCGVSKVKMSLLRTRNKLRDYLEIEGYL